MDYQNQDIDLEEPLTQVSVILKPGEMVIGDQEYVFYTQQVWIRTQGYQNCPWNICSFEFGLSYSWRKTKGVVPPFVATWEDHIFQEYKWFKPLIIYHDQNPDQAVDEVRFDYTYQDGTYQVTCLGERRSLQWDRKPEHQRYERACQHKDEINFL